MMRTQPRVSFRISRSTSTTCRKRRRRSRSADKTTLALTENVTPVADFGGLAVIGGDHGIYTYSLVSTNAVGNTNPDAIALAQLYAINNGTNLRQTAFLNYEDYTGGTFTFKIHTQNGADAATGSISSSRSI